MEHHQLTLISVFKPLLISLAGVSVMLINQWLATASILLGIGFTVHKWIVFIKQNKHNKNETSI